MEIIDNNIKTSELTKLFNDEFVDVYIANLNDLY